MKAHPTTTPVFTHTESGQQMTLPPHALPEGVQVAMQYDWGPQTRPAELSNGTQHSLLQSEFNVQLAEWP